MSKWKRKIKKRDNEVCRRCGFDKHLHVHHILPKQSYPLLEFCPANGITLCGNCHSLLKGKEIRTNFRSFIPGDPKIDSQLKQLNEDYSRFYGTPNHSFLLFPDPVSRVLEKGESSKKTAETIFNRGKKRYKVGKYDLAIKSFGQALMNQSDFPDAYYFRGCAKYDLKQYGAAIFDFDNAISLKPDCVYAYIMRGKAKYELEQYDSACQNYDMVFCLNCDEIDKAEIYRLRGMAKFQMESFDGTIDDCNLSLRVNPDDAHTYRLRGLARERVGKFDDAINDFNKAIDLTTDKFHSLLNNPKKKQVCKAKFVAVTLQMLLLYINRGDAKERLGSIDAIEEAELDFRRALRLAPLTNDPEKWCKYIQEKLSNLGEHPLTKTLPVPTRCQ